MSTQTLICTDYHLMINGLPDGIIKINELGLIQFLNPAAESMLGFSLSESLGCLVSNVLCLVDSTSDELIHCVGMKSIHAEDEANAGNNALLIGRDGLSELPVEVIAKPTYSNEQLSGAILVIRDVRLARFSRNQLSWNASHDSLTGLFNRFEFEQQCKRIMQLAIRDHTEHMLLLIDVDNFHQLNELAGNCYGDELLIQLSQRIRNQLRAADHLSRNHSDQFFILLSHCSLDHAVRIAETLRQQIEAFSLDIEHGQWPVTCSIGITPINFQCPATVNELICEADAALQEAKQLGRNQVKVFNRQNYSMLHTELVALNEAIENGQFNLYYQIIESLEQNKPCCEIIVRYPIAEDCEKDSAYFTPLLENFGLITQLDLWVVQEILDLASSKIALQDCFERIHVNLSAHSLNSQFFLDALEGMLANQPVAQGLLCFEVSKNSLHTNINHTQRNMEKLARLGCVFAIDDVDANLTSFDRLSKLPIKLIKIESELIKHLSHSTQSQLLLSTINQIAQLNNLMTVAQNVNSFEAYEWLKLQKTDYVQGDCIHQPESLSYLITQFC